MIRKANREDLSKIFDACEPLHAQSGHPLVANKETWVHGWKNLLDGSGTMYVAVDEAGNVQGALGGVFFPDLNGGYLKAAELLWYVTPESRGGSIGWKLVHLFWNEAKSRGVRVVTGSALLQNESYKTLERFYLRNGFKPLETVFVKEL